MTDILLNKDEVQFCSWIIFLNSAFINSCMSSLKEFRLFLAVLVIKKKKTAQLLYVGRLFGLIKFQKPT